jgi:hypothetical protein
VIVWKALEEAWPPIETMLFLRLRHEDSGLINFCTGFWNPEARSFSYYGAFNRGHEWSLPGWWKVTHWAMSEAANKHWFTYVWDKEPHPMQEPAPEGRIL